jgi:cytoskeleton protein RodZ
MNESTADGRSAGALLKAAREKQGLHIAALAAAIKVSQRKLEALEGDRFDELPDATFTRALAQTVCRTLKIDARPVLDLLPPAAPVVLDTTSGSLNAPFRERPGREDPGLSGVALRPLVLAAAVFMLAAAAVYLLPAGLFSRAPQTTPAVALPTVQAPAAEAPPPVLVQAPMVVAPAASEPTPAASAPEPAAPVPVSAESPAPAPSGLVQLKSREASWVEARDARGQVLLFRTVLPGESVGLDGTLPIRLTIGNAAATQLGFRGQPVDLVSRTRDNVARVELQ